MLLYRKPFVGSCKLASNMHLCSQNGAAGATWGIENRTRTSVFQSKLPCAGVWAVRSAPRWIATGARHIRDRCLLRGLNRAGRKSSWCTHAHALWTTTENRATLPPTQLLLVSRNIRTCKFLGQIMIYKCHSICDEFMPSIMPSMDDIMAGRTSHSVIAPFYRNTILLNPPTYCIARSSVVKRTCHSSLFSSLFHGQQLI